MHLIHDPRGESRSPARRRRSLPSRVYYAVFVALVIVFALGLQLVLSVRLSLERGHGLWHGVWMYLAFFTVLTNLLAAGTVAAPLLVPRSRIGRYAARAEVISGVALYIAAVGIVYHLFLRDLWHPRGWQWLADVLLHDANPLLFLGYWWWSVPRGALSWRVITGWCVYPALYFFYVLLRGAVSHFYPYPFLDVNRLGYLRVLGNATALLVGFILLGGLLVGLKRIGLGRSGHTHAHGAVGAVATGARDLGAGKT